LGLGCSRSRWPDSGARARRIGEAHHREQEGQQAGGHQEARRHLRPRRPGRDYRVQRVGPPLRRGGQRHPRGRGETTSSGGTGSTTPWTAAAETTSCGPASAGTSSTPGRNRSHLGGRATATWNVIECGLGFDRVVYSRRTFNCESVRAIRGRGVPGRIWASYEKEDYWNDAVGQFRDVLIGLGNEVPLNGRAGADLILGRPQPRQRSGWPRRRRDLGTQRPRPRVGRPRARHGPR
jgi:hypothetical protein